MKILEVSKLYPPFYGGIESVVYDISTVLRHEGYIVDVLCVTENNESIKETIDDVNIYRCASLLKLASTYISIDFFKVWKKIRNNYDVIHIHLPNPLALLAFFLFKPKKIYKIIVHWHSDIIKQRFLKLLFITLQNSLLKVCDHIIATSQVYADTSWDLKHYMKKVTIIPIGIDEEKMKSTPAIINAIKKRYKKKFLIFSTGRHVYYKGFEYLIESAIFLNKNFIIILGGQGILTKKLQAKIIKHNLCDRVKLLGTISSKDLSGYFNAADVFCLPSIERSEAYAIVQIEAMACGTPVVSTNIKGSGVSWVNKHGVTGLIVPARNPKVLANSFIYLYKNPINKKQVKNYFYQNYTRSKMIRAIIKLIENAYA